MKKLDIIIVAFVQIQLVSCLFDPITIGISSAVSYALYKVYNQCNDNECCTSDWIPINTHELQRELSNSLHGQQIAAETVLRALRGYKNERDPPKALTMSFHGLPGSGKNFVANMIVKAFFKLGAKSKYYHFFNGRSYAPRESLLEYYQDKIRETIVESLLECKRSLFVFDEIDMMPVGLLNVLVPFIDHSDRISVEFRGRHVSVEPNEAIFIFLSNTGSKEIVNQMLKSWVNGENRDDMKLSDFENLIALGAFNERGGFHKSEAIRTNLIDHYVPFMPLEKKHVKLCMRDAFRYRTTPTESMENEVLESLTWGPEPYNIYSKSGCKKIETKVISISHRSRN